MIQYSVMSRFSLRPAIIGYPLFAGMTAVQNNWPRSLVAAELVPQLGLGALQAVALRFRQGLAGAVDIERQHRERRAIGARLAARTAFRRALERSRDFLRAGQLEDALLQIERVALPRHALRPALWRFPLGCRFPPCRTRLPSRRIGRIFPGSRFARCGFARTRRFPTFSHIRLHAVSAKNGDEPDRFLYRNAGTRTSWRRWSKRLAQTLSISYLRALEHRVPRYYLTGLMR